MHDKDNPLRDVNNLCYLLKKFLNSHSGFDRRDLQNYINLFSFMVNKLYNKLEKVYPPNFSPPPVCSEPYYLDAL